MEAAVDDPPVAPHRLVAVTVARQARNPAASELHDEEGAAVVATDSAGMRTIRVGEPDGRLLCAGVTGKGKAGALRSRSRRAPFVVPARCSDGDEDHSYDHEADVAGRPSPSGPVSYWV